MATTSSKVRSGTSVAIAALVESDGTGASPHAQALIRPAAALRDVADAVHALCTLHGTLPGIVDHAAHGAQPGAVGEWLTQAASGFADERALLARLTAAVGPLPSTPGQAASDSAILTQRSALEMLARSDRVGCAAGTAFAFVLDWAQVRGVLDVCADRLGIVTTALYPASDETAAVLDHLDVAPGVARAMTFGAQQMLAQHRGLWQLLEARASARAAL